MSQRLNNALEAIIFAMALIQLVIGDAFAALVLIAMAYYISTDPFERWLGGH